MQEYFNDIDELIFFLVRRQWDQIMQQAGQNVNVLDNAENLKILSNILKTNVSACVSVGPSFFVQLGRIYMDLLGLYKAVSELVSDIVAQTGIHLTMILI